MYTYNYSVAPEDMDTKETIKVSSLCRCVINSIGQNIKEEGYGIDVMHSEGRSWVLSRYVFEFDERPGLYSQFFINVMDGEAGNVLLSRCVRIYDQNHREIGRGTTDWCIIDMNTRRLLRLPDALISQQSRQTCPDIRPERISVISIDERQTRRVHASDCDFNGHVNNIRYLEMMYDMLPSATAVTECPLKLSAFFHHEAKNGQLLNLGLGRVEKGYDFVIADAKRTICTLSLRSA